MVNRYAFITFIGMLMMGAGATGNATEEGSDSVRNTPLNSLIELAKEQTAEDDGKQYWWRVFGILDKISDDKFEPCVSKKSDPAAMYKYVLEIGAGGAIKKVHWEKFDDFTKCIDKVLVGIDFPVPPESPFYFYLSEI